jgi:uncharacterized membrane protein
MKKKTQHNEQQHEQKEDTAQTKQHYRHPKMNQQETKKNKNKRTTNKPKLQAKTKKPQNQANKKKANNQQNNRPLNKPNKQKKRQHKFLVAGAVVLETEKKEGMTIVTMAAVVMVTIVVVVVAVAAAVAVVVGPTAVAAVVKVTAVVLGPIVVVVKDVDVRWEVKVVVAVPAVLRLSNLGQQQTPLAKVTFNTLARSTCPTAEYYTQMLLRSLRGGKSTRAFTHPGTYTYMDMS